MLKTPREVDLFQVRAFGVSWPGTTARLPRPHALKRASETGPLALPNEKHPAG